MTLKSVEVGFMRLYSSVRPALEAGKYRIDLDQEITGGDSAISGINVPSSTDVPRVSRHIEVVGPRFALPGTEIHSVFPPPNSVGPFHNRLPHIALKRRTLPWERDPDPEGSGDIATRPPWLALVLLAEGEANFMRGVDIEDAMPQAVYDRLDPAPGTCDTVEVTTDVIREVFPREGDFEFLVHVRQVNVNDTENAGDDEDGFMSVIMTNRLPQAGQKYGAYLISLEGRLPELPDDDPNDFVDDVGKGFVYEVPFEDMVAASYTKGSNKSGVNLAHTNQPASAATAAGSQMASYTAAEVSKGGAAFTEVRKSGWHESVTTGTQGGQSSAGGAKTAAFGQGFMLNDIDFAVLVEAAVKVRFPVLAYWQFECSEGKDFEELMTDLDVGMLGAPPADDRIQDADFPVVADTGHTLVSHLTRGGVAGSAWYRGPFTPRQVARREAEVPFHTADQARTVGGDRIENLGEAAAFEVGRLLALADPSFLQELLRWRRDGFRLLRTAGMLEAAGLGSLLVDGLYATNVARNLASGMFAQLAAEGAVALGPRIDPGAGLGLQETDAEIIAAGFNTTLTRVRTAFGEGPGLSTPGLEPGFDDGPRITGFDDLVRGAATELAHLDDALGAEVDAITDSVILPDRDGRDIG